MSTAARPPITPGLPSGSPLSVIARPEWFPAGADPQAYALLLDGSCLEPAMADGSMVICSPAAIISAGDFVALWPLSGKPHLKRLLMAPMIPVGTPRHPASDAVPAVVVEMLNPPQQFSIRINRLKAMHRVVGTYAPDEIRGMRVPTKPVRRFRSERAVA